MAKPYDDRRYDEHRSLTRKRRLRILSYVGLGVLAIVAGLVTFMAISRAIG